MKSKQGNETLTLARQGITFSCYDHSGNGFKLNAIVTRLSVAILTRPRFFSFFCKSCPRKKERNFRRTLKIVHMLLSQLDHFCIRITNAA